VFKTLEATVIRYNCPCIVLPCSPIVLADFIGEENLAVSIRKHSIFWFWKTLEFCYFGFWMVLENSVGKSV